MERMATALSIAGGAIFGGTILLNNFFFTVDAGHRGIIFDRFFGGIKPKIFDEGMHFIIPFQQVSPHPSFALTLLSLETHHL